MLRKFFTSTNHQWVNWLAIVLGLMIVGTLEQFPAFPYYLMPG